MNGVTVDLGNETIHDAAGESVPLRAQAFAVLRYLNDHAGQLVTKDALMQAVWPNVAVTDDSLVQCIHEIRRVLGDEGHSVLKTVPRRGYRLALPADSGGPAPSQRSPKPRWASPAVVAAVAVAVVVVLGLAGLGQVGRDAAPSANGPPVLAVLPFDNLGDDPQQSYFADGITEDLITDLSKISGVLVIARNSVWGYRGASSDIREVADDLGAGYVLEGSVRRDGEALRINAQLIDTRTGTHLWAGRYDGQLGSVFELQDRVIAEIVSALAIQLTAQERAATAEIETTSVEAYEALLLGMEHLHRDTGEDTSQAIALFEHAVALDPAYSRAYAAIAAAQLRVILSIWITTTGVGLDNALNSMISNLAKAMENPTSLSYSVAAVWASQIGRYDEAFDAIAKAQALAPNDADVLASKARILLASGKAAEAEGAVRLALRLDPSAPATTLRVLSMVLFELERYEEALEIVERIGAKGTLTTDDYLTTVASLGHLGRTEGVAEAVAAYNQLAAASAWDPMTVQEALWYWSGDLTDYHRPYANRLADGLQKAGIPEGAGMDIPYAQYRGLMSRVGAELAVDGATELTAAEAKAALDRGVPFVDVRAHTDYANGHVPGAVNLSLVVDLSRETLSEVAGPGDEVAFYCHSKYCSYSAIAAAKAITWGYTKVLRFAGGFPAWQAAGYPVEVGASQ